jgi:hypothetical protein
MGRHSGLTGTIVEDSHIMVPPACTHDPVERLLVCGGLKGDLVVLSGNEGVGEGCN